MFSLVRPDASEIRRYLDAAKTAPWSYAEVGATRWERSPPGYSFDRQQTLLGYGPEAFSRAKRALAGWQMLPRPLVRVCWPDAPIEPGTVIALLLRGGPVWSLNAARIVYVVHEAASEATRFGFAYGTLADHAEDGEERFLVEWRHADDSVWYDLAAISRPRHPLARLAYPYVRWQQARFRRQSALAMQRAVAADTAADTLSSCAPIRPLEANSHRAVP